jgi:hypothetical protein
MKSKKPRIGGKLHGVVVAGIMCRLLDVAAESHHSSIVAQTKTSLDRCVFFGGAGFETGAKDEVRRVVPAGVSTADAARPMWSRNN